MQISEDSAQTSQQVNDADYGYEGQTSEGESGVDFAAALYRYIWAFLTPALIGFIVGLVLWTQLPQIWESKSRMLVESDQPLMMDTVTGEVLNGIPTPDVMQAQLYSDEVLRRALNHTAVNESTVREVLDQEYGGNLLGFIADGVEFESSSEGGSKASSLVFDISARHSSEELTRATVIALTNSLQSYYEEKRESSLDGLKSFIKEAIVTHGEVLTKLQEEYREWRRNKGVELEFDENGIAINPYRTEIARLSQQRTTLSSELRAAETEAAVVKETIHNSPDPRTAIDIVGQLLNKQLMTPTDRRRMLGLGQDDYDLKLLGFEEQLVPLYVEREQMAATYDENHPSVKALDQRIASSEKEFKRLSKDLTDRLKTLSDNTEQENKELQVAAESVVKTMIAKEAMLRAQLQHLDKEIDALRSKAIALASAEEENASRRKQIQRAEDLALQLKDQIGRISLNTKDSGIELSELRAPNKAIFVGPNLLVLLFGGTGVGLLIGAGLAYLLESQAGTFRSADEITTALGLPIIGHLPFDPGRRRRLKKGEEDPYFNLDDKLSVLHRPSSVAAEAVRACRTTIMFDAASSHSKLIQVTSPLPSDGKTTTAGNLAVSIAQTGKRVLLVDCDLRRPQMSDNFDLGSHLGFTNILNGDCEISEGIAETKIENLHVMPSGPIPANPAEALTLPETGELFQWLREKYDYVIVDTPPLLVVTDASIIANQMDGVVLTMKIRRKSKSSAREAVSILRAIQAKVIGIVVNASDETSGSDGYRGYGSYRYSRYATKYGGDSKYASASTKRAGRTGMTVSGRGKASSNGVNGNAVSSTSGASAKRNGASTLHLDDDSSSAIGLLPPQRDTDSHEE